MIEADVASVDYRLEREDTEHDDCGDEKEIWYKSLGNQHMSLPKKGGRRTLGARCWRALFQNLFSCSLEICDGRTRVLS